MRVDQNVTLDALLTHIGPAVSAHPLPLALRALVLAETALLALVWGQTFALGPCLDREERARSVVLLEAWQGNGYCSSLECKYIF